MEGDALPHLMPGTATGHLEAWRAWRVDPAGRLVSLMVPLRWNPDHPMVDFTRLTAGVYAFKTRDRLKREIDIEMPGLIYGQVALWGDVVEHAHGYRAQFAYPLALECNRYNRHAAKRLAETYSCELLGVTWRDRLAWWLAARVDRRWVRRVFWGFAGLYVAGFAASAFFDGPVAAFGIAAMLLACIGGPAAGAVHGLIRDG